MTIEEQRIQRDHGFAELIDALKKIDDAKQRETLVSKAQALENLTMLLDMNRDLGFRRADSRLRAVYAKLLAIFDGKYIRGFLLAFLAGLVVALIPTLLYIHLQEKAMNIPYQFVATHLGFHKPQYVQTLNTPEQVEEVKKYPIRDRDMADIGSALKLGRTGLNLMPSVEMKSPLYHLKFVGLQKDKIANVGGFLFKPDTLVTFDPIQLQLMTTQEEIDIVKKQKNIDNKDLLSIGSGVVCPSVKCFVTAKSTLDTEYIKVIPIAEQHP